MHDLTKAIVLVTIVFLLVAFSGNFVYSENDEPAMECVLQGVFFGAPIPHIDFGVKALSLLYVFLYKHSAHGINYFGVSLILLNYLAFVILTFLLIRQKSAAAPWLALLFLFFALYSIFTVSFTTSSMLACLAGHLLFLHALLGIRSPRAKAAAILVASCTIILAYLMRPSSGELAVILFAPFWCWQALFKAGKARKAVLATVMIPFAASIFIKRQFTARIDPEQRFDVQAIGFFSKVNNFGYSFAPRNKTQEKLFYEIKNWYFFDKETLSLKEYAGQLRPPGKASNLKPAASYLKKSLLNRRTLPYVALIAAPFLLLFFFKSRNIQSAIFYLSVAFYPAVLVMIALFLKMPPRIAIPILLTAIFFILMHYADALQLEPHRPVFRAIAFFVIALVLFQGWSAHRDLRRERLKAERSWSALMKYLNVEKPEYVFLTWAYEINYFPLRHVPWNSDVKSVPLVGWMSYYPRAHAFLREITGTNDVRGIFRWIAANRSRAGIYSDAANNLVLGRIFAYHKINARLSPVRILDAATGKGLYEVSSDET